VACASECLVRRAECGQGRPNVSPSVFVSRVDRDCALAIAYFEKSGCWHGCGGVALLRMSGREDAGAIESMKGYFSASCVMPATWSGLCCHEVPNRHS